MSTSRRISGEPFLSICIPSYNRVNELFRCLKSVDVKDKNLIEIVVSEDCSPRRQEIAQVVNRFVAETGYHVVYNTNAQNLGFDRNFWKLIGLASGDYILFMTDDDTLCEGALDKVIDALRECDCAAAFSPYVVHETGRLEREFEKTMLIPEGISSARKYLYCSILLSGLIVKRNRIGDYSAERFKDLIYSQVYLFASLLYKHGGCYVNVPLVECVGDGENAYGLNDASDKNELLSDRKSVYSNLEFNKGLVKIVRMFDDDNGTDLMSGFAREYSLRSYTGMYRARKAGKRELTGYWNRMKALDIEISIISRVYYVALRLLGCGISDAIFRIPRSLLLGIRRKSST